MAMIETPGEEVDWMCSMPGTEFTEVSMTLVTLSRRCPGWRP